MCVWFVVFLLLQRAAGDLMIRNIQLKHAGKYVCVIDTDVESLSAAAILIVKGKEKLFNKAHIHEARGIYKCSCITHKEHVL